MQEARIMSIVLNIVNNKRHWYRWSEWESHLTVNIGKTSIEDSIEPTHTHAYGFAMVHYTSDFNCSHTIGLYTCKRWIHRFSQTSNHLQTNLVGIFYVVGYPVCWFWLKNILIGWFTILDDRRNFVCVWNIEHTSSKIHNKPKTCIGGSIWKG